MAVTYIRRKREELADIVQRVKENDMIRKADLLSESPDPDHIFDGFTIRSQHPFGVLVMFGNNEERKTLMRDLPRCDDLDYLEQLIDSFKEYPPVTQRYFEEKRQAYLKDIRRYRHINNRPAGVDRERQRLESAVKTATVQKEWLAKENTDRLRKIREIEEEIRQYERALERRRMTPDNTEKIRQAVEQSEPLRQDIEEDTAKLRDLAQRIDALRAEQAITNKELSPTTSRLQEMEAERLTGEQQNLVNRINDNTSKLKKLEEQIETMEQEDAEKPNEEELVNSIGQTRKMLQEKQVELDGGHRMANNLDLRVEILAARLETIRRETASQPEDIENAYIAAVARAEELVTAWVSSSKVLRRILDVDGISGRELVEALFFAGGPLSGAGPDACLYLNGADVSLDTLLLYDTEEERIGFRHTIVFE